MSPASIGGGKAQITGGEHISRLVETPTEVVLPVAKPDRRRYNEEKGFTFDAGLRRSRQAASNPASLKRQKEGYVYGKTGMKTLYAVYELWEETA